MLFLPYRIEVSTRHLPLVTLAIILVCLLVYFGQQRNETALNQALHDFCSNDTQSIRTVLAKLGYSVSMDGCQALMVDIHTARDPARFMRDSASLAIQRQWVEGREDNMAFRQSVLQDQIRENYRKFAALAPAEYTTSKLWYTPDSLDLWHMVTAVFAHGGIRHLLGNLYFFFLFAMAVEAVLGPLNFLAAIVILILGTQGAYYLAMQGQSQMLPTLGLSGVVMGVMTMFAVFLPRARVRCFLWLIVFFKFFTISAWLLVLGFVLLDGWNFYTEGLDSSVNLVAHLSGAMLGAAMAWLLFARRRAQLSRLA